jgi:non-ribosomal peptide synthetase-like protein
MQGTVLQIVALRALGTRIGHRVHIHRGVNLLQGGWDLLEIGDDVTLSQDAAVRLVDLDDGNTVVGPVSIGSGSTLDVRAGVGPNTVLEADAFLSALSFLPSGGRIPRGERWDGLPAVPAGQSPDRPQVSGGEWIVSPCWHGVALILARSALWMFLALCLEVPIIALVMFYSVDSDRLLSWLFSSSHSLSLLLAAFLMVTLPVPLTVAMEAIAIRATGRVSSGVVSRWSLSYVRVWLKAEIVQSAGHWLSGTIFWPMWLRLAGMNVGRGCEISTIIDVVPELIEIGDESFFADGIHLCGPRVHRGTVTLAPTRFGKNTFLGNHSVVPGGQRLPDNVLIGVCTVADDATVRSGTAWFGHPPFELPRRENLEVDRKLTHEPSLIRYLDRVFWELLRNGLPAVPLMVLPFWFRLLASAENAVSPPVFFLAVVPSITLGMVALLSVSWFLRLNGFCWDGFVPGFTRSGLAGAADGIFSM